MVRVTSSVTAHKRKKRMLKQAKGQYAQRSKRYSQARRSVVKGKTYAFRDRKVRRREFRGLWIIRINAACQQAGLSYSRFMRGLTLANVGINRKLISELAIASPDSFNKLVEVSKEALAGNSGDKKNTSLSAKK